MDFKATIAKGYRTRLLLIAIGAMLYAAWCLYDAMIGYPDGQLARETFEQVQDEHPEDWKTKWPEVAAENGWDGTKEPDEVSDLDIGTQWIQFGIVFPIGAYCLYSLAVWSRRYIGVDGSKLYATGGVEVPFDKVTSIEASRWESKGIAQVTYDLGQGQKSVLIDDWKYEREPSGQIFQRLREGVDADNVIGVEAVSAEVAGADGEASATSSA